MNYKEYNQEKKEIEFVLKVIRNSPIVKAFHYRVLFKPRVPYVYTHTLTGKLRTVLYELGIQDALTCHCYTDGLPSNLGRPVKRYSIKVLTTKQSLKVLDDDTFIEKVNAALLENKWDLKCTKINLYAYYPRFIIEKPINFS